MPKVIEGCPNCKRINIEYCIIQHGFFSGTDTWGWQFFDEGSYDINYCPFCGLHLTEELAERTTING